MLNVLRSCYLNRWRWQWFDWINLWPALRFLSTPFPVDQHYISLRRALSLLLTSTTFHFNQNYASFWPGLRFLDLHEVSLQPACFLSTLPALRFLSTSTRRFPCNPHYISFDQPYVSFRPPLRFLGTHTSFHFDQHYVSFQHKLRFATLSFPCYPHYVYLLTSLCFLATHSMFPCIPQYVSLRPAVRFLATCTTFPCDPQYVS